MKLSVVFFLSFLIIECGQTPTLGNGKWDNVLDPNFKTSNVPDDSTKSATKTSSTSVKEGSEESTKSASDTSSSTGASSSDSAGEKNSSEAFTFEKTDLSSIVSGVHTFAVLSEHIFISALIVDSDTWGIIKVNKATMAVEEKWYPKVAFKDSAEGTFENSSMSMLRGPDDSVFLQPYGANRGSAYVVDMINKTVIRTIADSCIRQPYNRYYGQLEKRAGGLVSFYSDGKIFTISNALDTAFRSGDKAVSHWRSCNAIDGTFVDDDAMFCSTNEATGEQECARFGYESTRAFGLNCTEFNSEIYCLPWTYNTVGSGSISTISEVFHKPFDNTTHGKSISLVGLGTNTSIHQMDSDESNLYFLTTINDKPHIAKATIVK